MNAYFYNEIIENENNKELLKFMERYAEENLKQVYLIHKALGSNYEYDYTDVAVVLIPRHKILVIDWGCDTERFDEYYEDFIDDLGYISDKYEYKNVIGRKRQWKENLFKCVHLGEISNFSQLIEDSKLENPDEERLSQLLISLLTGSINDISKVGKEVPADILDAVKRRIVLYDGKQTEFIFSKTGKEVVTIQGLAGTGKTELLLRKLKELYTDNDSKNERIALTCFNKILAKNLKDRIPAFFDFLKVEEQIKWNETLFVMSSWGSNHRKYSGIYSYICDFYDIPFLAYSYERSFDYVCKKAIAELKERGNVPACFDYMLIDESQDFPQSYFELCKLVTAKQIYIAGDIFQNIFDIPEKETNPDFLLNKCYRTDPKTLIFAHAMGMGLLDSDSTKEYISWLTNEEWIMCGYEFTRSNGSFTYSRQPINRFEDIDTSEVTSVILQKNSFENYPNAIIAILDNLRDKYPTITPNDIGIVFLENETANYKMIDQLASLVYSKYNWLINKGYESKTKKENMLFVSNINNVKGLEFPFIICVSKNKLNKNLRIRNAMYMVLTRSFISSYLIISSDNDENVFDNINKKLKMVIDNGELTIKEPTESEKEQKRTAIISKKNINKSQKEVANEIMDQLEVAPEDRPKIHKTLKMFLEDENDSTMIFEFIEGLLRNIR